MSKWKWRAGPGTVSGKATQTSNLSERLVEEFCDHHGIEWWHVKETPAHKRPDYAIRVRGRWCVLEVKQIESKYTDNDLLGKVRWIAPGKRLRGPFRAAEHQLSKFGSRRVPTIICLLDTTASFHDVDFQVRAAMCGDETLLYAMLPSTGTLQPLGSSPGKNAMFRPNKNTTVSAVAVLRWTPGSEVVVDLYHNPFAAIRIEQDIAAPFVRWQKVVGIDPPTRRGLTLQFDVDDPAYEEFWRGP